MYKAILKRKNGQLVMKNIASVLLFIDLSFIEDRIHTPIEEFTDLTPDNIINIGGFTNIEIKNYRKIRFELIDQILDDNQLIYKEI